MQGCRAVVVGQLRLWWGGIHSELRPFSGLVPASRGGVKRRALGERTARIKLSFARLESWAGSVGFVGVDGGPWHVSRLAGW